MIEKAEKYFYTPHLIGGGLDAQILHLTRYLQVALAMKRIPVITNEFSSPKHRLHKSNKEVLVDLRRYIDFSKTEIFQLKSSGEIEQACTFQYIHEQDFDFASYSEDQIRYIDYTQIFDEKNENYPLVCMLSSEYIQGQKKIPELGVRLHSGLNIDFTLNYLLVFTPSKLVNNLTDVVLNCFGTTRKDMRLLSRILYEFPNLKCGDMGFYYEGLNYYACMHVRYMGAVQEALMGIRKSSELSKYVQRVVKTVYARNHKSMPLYIMSNIMDDNYFNFLKPKYDVYRYTDFEELREQFSGKEEVDHNLLYAVECNIMRHAAVRVFPTYRNLFIFEYPWLHTMNTFERIFNVT